MTLGRAKSRWERLLRWVRALDEAFDRDPASDAIGRLQHRMARLEARLSEIEAKPDRS